MERDPISKRLRFEIFKRDGFTCVYCGAPPTGGVMHLDHVIPVSAGGASTADNLVTACPSCNLGKSNVPLERKPLAQFSPEAALEHAEQLRAWAEAQREVTHARKDVEQEMTNIWCDSMGTTECSRDIPKRLVSLSAEWGMPRLMEAIGIVGGKSHIYTDLNRLKYLYGILRKWKEAGELVEAFRWVAENPDKVKGTP